PSVNPGLNPRVEKRPIAASRRSGSLVDLRLRARAGRAPGRVSDRVGDQMRGLPGAEEAREYARSYSLVPVHRELLADLLTPVRAYQLLCPAGEPGFLLESVEGGERLARYSFVGYRPQPFDVGAGDPLQALREVAATSVAPAPGLPGFIGGAVGYLGYEVARHFEKLPAAAGAAPAMPESGFLRAEDLAVFDHVTHR